MDILCKQKQCLSGAAEQQNQADRVCCVQVGVPNQADKTDLVSGGKKFGA